MKKKNLIILLIFPFLISVFCIVTVNTTYNMVDVDISHIDWNYNDIEGFKVSDSLYELKASGVNQRHYKVSGDTALIWSVANKDTSDPDPCAEIVVQNGRSYLKALRTGEVIVTCSNVKGNVYRQMTAIMYTSSLIMMYPTVGSSQTNIDSTIYYGEYDHRSGNTAVIDMTVVAVPSSMKGDLLVETSDNVSFDLASGRLTVQGTGNAYITVSDPTGEAAAQTFSFEIVKDGVNVYTYDDLLSCTNYSDGGEIVVLRKHFESLENAYYLNSDGTVKLSGGSPVPKSNNVECFGNYNPATRGFSFADEIYSFTTTYSTEFIDQWNEFVKENRSYSPISDQVKVGLHVQKDFYGNGYTVNMHNLTYPYASVPMTGPDGTIVRIPQLTSANLFRGPLKLYSLGDPSNLPLVSLYGQDNVGMYVEGDRITVNDVNLKNCDFGDRMENLDTVGTVLEIYGSDVTVKNSRLSNGKNVVRSFSSDDLTIKNCLISNARNFLFLTGSNEYEKIDATVNHEFVNLEGAKLSLPIEEYLAKGGEGDALLTSFLLSTTNTPAERNAMRAALTSIQSALNASSGVKDKFKGSTTIEDTYFYRSGITAICLETLFNGPFLETASPSIIGDIFAMLQSEGKSLIPYVATHVSGVSYPVMVNVKGDTRFYDYKETGKIDLGGLIEENISTIANNLGLYDGEISIDDIFPLQSIMVQTATAQGSTYSKDGKTYVNVPVAYYGGGLNYSKVMFNSVEADVRISAPVEVDLLSTYLVMKGSSSGSLFDNMRGIMLKTVTTVSGVEPFSFVFVRGGYLHGETPNATDLVERGRER